MGALADVIRVPDADSTFRPGPGMTIKYSPMSYPVVKTIPDDAITFKISRGPAGHCDLADLAILGDEVYVIGRQTGVFDGKPGYEMTKVRIDDYVGWSIGSPLPEDKP